MTSAAHVLSMVLVVGGTAVIVASCLGALSARGPFACLHFATPITSLGGPLIAVGLSVRQGANLTTASVLLPTALLFFTGPLLSSAVARAMAERDRTIATGPEEIGNGAEGAARPTSGRNEAGAGARRPRSPA